jgi:cysteinyl-tRNA synthetase
MLLGAAAACSPAATPSHPKPVATASATIPTATPPRPTRDGGLAAWPNELWGPGFPEAAPWVSFYGNASQMGDVTKVARTYRIINIDADPTAANFTDAQLELLKNGGKNRVLSYFNIGACEHYRAYWSAAPQGLVSCSANRVAQRGTYEGYPDETWMDPSNADYQTLLLDHVAPRIASRVDGFYLDNLEILEHSSMSKNGPCSSACKQGGLDFVRKLREKYPKHLIVMQNATGEITRRGTTGGVPFPMLLDGVAHEEVYAPQFDDKAEAELLAWKALDLQTGSGRALWIGVEDYVGGCANKAGAAAALGRSRARGFSGYASDESGSQKVVCFWD